MMTVDIPFFSRTLFDDDRAEMLRLVRTIALAGEQKFILGAYTAQLEERLRESVGGSEVVACGSGTSALELILRAMRIGPGDEVVVPAFSCAPLACAVLEVGARPVFADVDPMTLVLDPADAERRITRRTRAIMPAHTFSVLADMPAFAELARAHDLRLVEDSAVAQGAVCRGRPAGTWGEAGAFSFVPVKSFGMPGEGGAVVTGDAELARRVRMLRNHGQETQRFVYHVVGRNSRFDEIQAAFQLARLDGLPERLARRAAIAERYDTALAEVPGIQLPPSGRDGRCYYVYTLLADDREGMRRHLAERGIGTHVYYPTPLPRQPAFAPLVDEGDCWPNAEAACRRILSLPLHPRLTDAEVDRVVEAVLAHDHEIRTEQAT